MNAEYIALIAIILGLICGLIGHLMPSGTHVTNRFKPKDSKQASAQGDWEGLEPRSRFQV